MSITVADERELIDPARVERAAAKSPAMINPFNPVGITLMMK